LPVDIDHNSVAEQLDGVVTVDVDRSAEVIGGEPEEIKELGGLEGNVKVITGRGRDGRKGEFLAVGAAAVVGGAEPVYTQVRDVVDD
jgi:hypothetical protein